jgi:Cysteine-rich secretory protein family
MPELKWDNELASFAELNVKQCEQIHDNCRSTRTFPHTGQHLALRTNKKFPDVEASLQEMIQIWFSDNKLATESEKVFYMIHVMVYTND